MKTVYKLLNATDFGEKYVSITELEVSDYTLYAVIFPKSWSIYGAITFRSLATAKAWVRKEFVNRSNKHKRMKWVKEVVG